MRSAAGDLGEVIVAAQRGHQEHRFVSALAIHCIGPFGNGQPGLANVALADRSLIIVRHLAQEIVEASNHDHGETFAWRNPVRFGARDSGTVPLRDRDHLRDGEADGARNGDSFGDAILQHVDAAPVAGNFTAMFGAHW